MRKIIVIALLLCINNVFAQTGKTAGDLGGPQCPPGTCGISIQVTATINFHKPRTGCISGFGFCIKGGSASVICTPCNSAKPTSSVTNENVEYWISYVGKKAELHLPLALKDAKGFEKQDMSSFSLEDGSYTIKDSNNKSLGSLKGGTYPVTIKGDEYIVTIDII